MSENLYVRLVRRYLPSPFSIAAILTLLAFLLTFIFTRSSLPEALGFWHKGFWELLAFSMQMVLILVLGHSIALTPLAEKGISFITRFATNSGRAAAIICFTAMFTGFINWGLCLIVGAILARKTGEKARAEGIPLNYPLIAAAGYSGMMVWHGGFSGSAPLVIAEENHFLINEIGRIPVSETLLSPLNIYTTILLLICVPLILYFTGRNTAATPIPDLKATDSANEKPAGLTPAEKIDQGRFMASAIGFLIVAWAVYTAWQAGLEGSFSFLDLNYVNFCLFGISLLLHGSVGRFLEAIQEAVGGASGIIIQFPLYAGIMGLMKYSGLIVLFSGLFISVSDSQTLPVLTFLSAGLVNIFVPSGGGQWAVQGPLIAEASAALGASVSKTVMAMAYGDGLTNMLQPFWALPLLGITRLDARDILPYSSIILAAGSTIYLFCLWFF